MRLQRFCLPIVLSWIFTPTCFAQVVHHQGRLVIGDDWVDERMDIDVGTEYYQTGDIAVIGNGELRVRGELHLNGHLYLAGDGRVLVDGGEIHISGQDTNLYVSEQATLEFINGAFLHYVQDYVAQHNIIGWGEGSVRFDHAEVDCDGSVEFVYLTENASYVAKNITYNHWKTWYLWDNTQLHVERANIGGDIVFYDQPTILFKEVNVIMPWLHFDHGAMIDLEFPEPQNPGDLVTLVFDNSMDGVDGIPWSLSIEDCRFIAWGVNPYPGSFVTIRNSFLTMVMFRFFGSENYRLDGLMQADRHYVDQTIPVDDRLFRLINTQVQWWNWFPATGRLRLDVTGP